MGWRSIRNYFSLVSTLRYELQDGARRHELGMLDYGAVDALGAALKLLERAGRVKVQAQVLAPSYRQVSGLQARGSTPLTPATPTRRDRGV